MSSSGHLADEFNAITEYFLPRVIADIIEYNGVKRMKIGREFLFRK